MSESPEIRFSISVTQIDEMQEFIATVRDIAEKLGEEMTATEGSEALKNAVFSLCGYDGDEGEDDDGETAEEG